MNNRIEVGCLVMVVNSKIDPRAIGQMGTVVEKTFNGGFYNGRPNYFGDTPWCWVVSGLRTARTTSDGLTFCTPSSLLRIDDYNEETETQEEELTV